MKLTMPPLAGVLLAIVFWGVSFVATKVVLGELSPIAIVFARSAIAAVLLAGIVRTRGESVLPPRSSFGPLAVMGFLGVAFHGLLQARALTLTTAVNTGWLIALTPVWSALFAAALGRERFGGGKVTGIIVGFTGTLLVVTRGRLDAGVVALPATRGDLLVLASTVNWAIYSLLGHTTIRKLGPTRATAGAMFLGTLMLLPSSWRPAAQAHTPDSPWPVSSRSSFSASRARVSDTCAGIVRWSESRRRGWRRCCTSSPS